MKAKRDAARLEIFSKLLSGVAEEMGAVLGRSGHSPNIKERRDFSCAVCDRDGRLIAQAAHIPVHLGAVPTSMAHLMDWFEERGEIAGEGDVIIWNDPFRGGTHLPDITMAAPVYHQGDIVAYVVNRAHHADVGGMSPGSMPLAEEAFQEGLIIPMLHFARGWRVEEEAEDFILANVRTPGERRGDLRAQMGALRVGERRLKELAKARGRDELLRYMQNLQDYGEEMARHALGAVPEGEYSFVDYLDDDGMGAVDIPIRVRVNIGDSRMRVDFTGSSGEVEGPLNCPRSVTLSATYYVFRCLLPRDAPFNHGCLRVLEVIIPSPSLLDASWPRAVAGGNVETSQRIVDALLGALHAALPDLIPAASYGTMTNLALGGKDPVPFAYYETVAGGCGARPGMDGLDATHNHMTNTMNTPVEALEYAYPLRVLEYSIARGTGGRGAYRGGDGVLRRIEVLEKATITLLSDRRKRAPYGLAGGEDGRPGEDYLVRAGRREKLPSKARLTVEPGDILEIRTPGGGGHGYAGR
ncbi:MAG: hydantoinase B/oxoprolinase family protein [Actinobacteria bacterium]|nr:hydantoinase B/oxoprolinase family protein [Actinomycetota bacterium]